jgi:hypothetical protein
LLLAVVAMWVGSVAWNVPRAAERLDVLDPGKVAAGAEVWLEAALDREAAASPHPGRPVLHRLNRAGESQT